MKQFRILNRPFYITALQLCKMLKLRFIAKILLYLINHVANKKQDYIQRLYAVSPNPKSSCLCTNKIDIRYDLQIIVPVYNVEHYIQECIDSILNQKTRYSYIITIVNDGSPDNSRKILERYEGNRNVTIIDQDNRGLSGARNRALENINGKYVMFVDSDDKLADNAIESLLNAAKDSDADIVEGGLVFFKGKQIEKVVRFAYAQNVKDLTGFAWGKIIRSELMRHVHFPESYWFEDTIFSLILFDIATKMVQIEDFVYYYRQNEKGITKTSKGKHKAIDTVYITGQLLEDRQRLGLAFSRECYEKFLCQLRTNFYRTIFNKGVQLPIFLYSCHLKAKYFHKMESTEQGWRHLLNEALEMKDFGKYLDAIMLES